jgi:hypothetical protein
MEYTLKDKLDVTSDFIESLTEKGWQEIEYIQSQLTNLADTAESKKVRKLLNNLLTSYYVFVGSLESFDNATYVSEQPAEVSDEQMQVEITEVPTVESDTAVSHKHTKLNSTSENELEFSEPFEYFVDFDEPIGEPLTDKDLYNN